MKNRKLLINSELKIQNSKSPRSNSAFCILHSAFTLVELIVVIVILAILATIAFLSFSSQSASARDSTRLADMNNISKGLWVFQAVSWKYPAPDNKATISASGTLMTYQWYAWQSVLNMIKLSNWWTDPLNKSTYYTYSTNIPQTKFQLLGFLEDWNNVALSFVPESFADATSYSWRYMLTKWDQLWIVLSSWTNMPIQNTMTWIDIIKTSQPIAAVISQKIIASGTWEMTAIVSPNASCKRIKDFDPASKDGTYTIYPQWNPIEVFCDMTADWGWWALVFHGYPTDAAYSIHTLDKVNIWTWMTFTDVRLKYVNNPYVAIDTTNKFTYLSKNFIDYVAAVTTAPDTPNPRITFDNWARLVKNSMFYWYSNCWRVFWTPSYIWCGWQSNMFIWYWPLNKDWSWNWIIQPCDWTSTSKNAWAWQSECRYNYWDVLDDTIKEHVSWLTIKKWQEAKIFVR